MSELKPMEDMPVSIEVLAYHKDGKNFHPVKRVDERNVKMRWNSEYSQTIYNYHGWVLMPEKPIILKYAQA